MRALRLLAVLVIGLGAAACAPLQDTPAQERAGREWDRCRAAASFAQLLSIDPDGRLRVQVASGFDRAQLAGCLGPPAAAGLPEPVFVPRPVGP